MMVHIRGRQMMMIRREAPCRAGKSALFARFLASLLLLLTWAQVSAEDLYQILGVGKTASTKDIKRAYRRKALDTHPDKNTDVPADKAAEAFRQVVHAFEILSDEQSRQFYDRTGRTDRSSSTTNGRRDSGNWEVKFTWNFQRRTIRLKDKFEVQQAQSRVLHVVSLDQLRTIMLDDNDRLERNLLLCFVKPGRVQEVAEDEMVFPYPFAGMSSQGIWWEDLLQTVQIRFHRSSELSRFFGIPDADQMNEPIFLFGKRGQPLSDAFPRLQTSNRKDFEVWVWKQLQVHVEFVNNHSHPVEIYWLHGTRAKIKLKLEPGQRDRIISMLSHQFWARDARVDARRDSPGRYKLTDDSSLGNWKILNDTNVRIIIEEKTCFDLSGHCGFWRGHGECHKNKQFMSDVCQKTCGLCKETDPTQQHGTEF